MTRAREWQPGDPPDLPATDHAFEGRRRVLGTAHPRCVVPGCSETDPRALTGASPAIVCAEHAADRDGRSWLEAHHLAGRRNAPVTVWLPANWHARMTHRQQTAWRRELLRNPRADPLLRAEALLRGSRETVAVVLDEGLGPLETELADLRDYLVERIAPDWPVDFVAWLEGRRHAR